MREEAPPALEAEPSFGDPPPLVLRPPGCTPEEPLRPPAPRIPRALEPEGNAPPALAAVVTVFPVGVTALRPPSGFSPEEADGRVRARPDGLTLLPETPAPEFPEALLPPPTDLVPRGWSR